MAIRRIQIAFLSIAIVFLAAACNIQLRVTIDVQEDGSGKVTAAVGLDPIAQDQEAFEDLESILRTSDLSRSGWDFEASGKSADGYVWYEASKGFLSPEDIQGILEELTSSPNAFTGWELSIESSKDKRIYGITGEVDLREGFSIFTDTELSGLLEEPPLGISLEKMRPSALIGRFGEIRLEREKKIEKKISENFSAFGREEEEVVFNYNIKIEYYLSN